MIVAEETFGSPAQVMIIAEDHVAQLADAIIGAFLTEIILAINTIIVETAQFAEEMVGLLELTSIAIIIDKI